MPKCLLVCTLAVSWFVWSLPVQAQLLYEEDGLQLHGYKRIATKNAATCHVLENSHTEAKYEQIKDNDGQPLHVWIIELTVRNATGRPLSFMRADLDIESPYPPCTNWSGQGPGNGAMGGPYPGGVQWGRHSVTLSSPYGMRPWQELRETVFMAVFHTDEPSLERWQVNFTFGEPKEEATPPRQEAPPEPAPITRPPPDPVPIPTDEPNLGGKPTCAGQSKGTSCWLEISNQPGCHIWNKHLAAGEGATWTGECSQGLAQGNGKLKTVWDGTNEIQTEESAGSFQDGIQQGQWVEHWVGWYHEEGAYLDGERNGTWVLIDGSGSGSKGPYRNGVKHGKWIEHRCYGGELMSTEEGSYKNGERHGRWVRRIRGGRVEVSDYDAGRIKKVDSHRERWVNRRCVVRNP